MSFFNTFLMAFAYIALFVGMFIIYNTFSIIVAQRTREMAMLRAVGASRRQVLRSVLVESIVVGLVASAVGLGPGVLMSFGLRALLGAVGLEIPTGDRRHLDRHDRHLGLRGRVTVTVISAVAPAVRASRVKPIAALRDVGPGHDRLLGAPGPRRPRRHGAGVAAFAAGWSAETAADALPLLGLGAVAVIVGVFVLGPVIARPVVRVLGAPAPVLAGATGHLARENARRNPKRTAATASALMIGVALVGFITILAASTKASVSAAVDRSLRADYVVDSGSWGDGGFSPELDDDLAALPEVDAISPMRSAPVRIGAESTEVLAVDTAIIDELLDLDVTAGRLDEVTDGGSRSGRHRGRDHALAVGDPVTVGFARTGVRGPDGGGHLRRGRARGRRRLRHRPRHLRGQRHRPVRPPGLRGDRRRGRRRRLTAAIDAVLEDWPNAELQDQAAFKATSPRRSTRCST